MLTRLLKEARFRLGSARRAHELHERIDALRASSRKHEERLQKLNEELVAEKAEARTVERFHELYYERSQSTWQNTYYSGVRVMKCPLDLWVYQEIINEVEPELIIETGTALGGSALYLAHLCDLAGRGEVITVDVEQRAGNPVPEHERISYLRGSSTAPEVVDEISARASNAARVLVILDSDHSKDHVLAEMEAYAPLVSRGSYMIVEDTNVNGNPVLEDFGPGPMEAVDEFLSARGEFEIDRQREKFFMTFSPRGYLKRL